MSSGGVGRCNGISVGVVGNNSGSSSSSPSTSTVVDGRTADPIGVAKASLLGRCLYFFRLGDGRTRT